MEDRAAGEHARRVELAVQAGAEHEVAARDARPRLQRRVLVVGSPPASSLRGSTAIVVGPVGSWAATTRYQTCGRRTVSAAASASAHAQHRAAVAQHERGAVAERDERRLGDVQGREHPRLQRESLAQLDPVRVGDADARPDADLLVHAGMLGRLGDVVRLEAGAGRVVVAVDEPHDPRP